MSDDGVRLPSDDKTKDHQRDADAGPKIVTPAPDPAEQHQNSCCPKCDAEPKRPKRDWFDKLSLAVLVCAFLAAGAAAIEADRLDRLTLDQISLAYPSRIKIFQIRISPEGKPNDPVVLAAGNVIDGTAQAINIGREVSFIDSQSCMPYWREGPLPMTHPYFAAEINKCGFEARIGDGKKMRSGDISAFTFKTTVPPNYNPAMNLYVIGFIRYKDRLSPPATEAGGPNRFVLFARRYDPTEGRFVVVDNPDYEGQDFN